MNNISDRIEKILEYYQLNAGEFARKIGVQKSSISHLLSGRNKPSFLFLSKLIKAFPEINIKWFLTGEGNMVEKKETRKDENVQNSSPLPERKKNRISDDNFETLEESNNNETLKQNNTKAEEEKVSNNQKSETGTINKTKRINQIIMVYDNDTFKILTQAED